MTVGELTARMSREEFAEWAAEDKVRAAEAKVPSTPDEQIAHALAAKAESGLTSRRKRRR